MAIAPHLAPLAGLRTLVLPLTLISDQNDHRASELHAEHLGQEGDDFDTREEDWRPYLCPPCCETYTPQIGRNQFALVGALIETCAALERVEFRAWYPESTFDAENEGIGDVGWRDIVLVERKSGGAPVLHRDGVFERLRDNGTLDTNGRA